MTIELLDHNRGCRCFLCAATPGGWKHNTVMVSVSTEVAEDLAQSQDAMREIWEQMNYDITEAMLDESDGPRLGPGRNEWHQITWPERRAAVRRNNIRWNLDGLISTHRPGRFVRHR